MVVPFISPVTDIGCSRRVNGFTLSGLIWNARPHQISDSDNSARAVLYRIRNPYSKVVALEAYLNIEYAHQPIGSRRLTPSVMKAPDRDMDCTKQGFVPPQGYSEEGSAHGTRDEWGPRGSANYASFMSREDERSVVLNVFVPKGVPPIGGWPVFIFFHGGGNNYLSTTTLQLQPDNMVVEGMIVVTAEYRLATLGNWYHPDMESEPGYQGPNFSITDCIAALEWVHAFIGSFGGNKDKKTIGGSSAGGNHCNNLVLHPYAKTLFQRVWMSSSSTGTNTRWSKETTAYTWGFQNWHAVRHAAIAAASPYLCDSQDTNKTLASAVAEKGFLQAVRENMTLEDFLSLDGGGWDLTGSDKKVWTYNVWYPEGNQVADGGDLYDVAIAHRATTVAADLAAGRLVKKAEPNRNYGKSLTVMNDGITCFWSTNRAAAVAQAYSGTHQYMIVVGQQESSVIGFGLESHSWDKELFELSGESMNEWINGPIVNRESTGAAGAAWVDYEINRQIFNFGYQHTAKRVAQAVTEVGGSAWLVYGNYKLRNSSTAFAGHGWDVSYLFGTINYSVPEYALTADDVFVCDGLIKALRNFCHTGDPNIDPWLTGAGLDLFADEWVYPFSKYSLADRNWNVVGSAPWRSAAASTPDMTTRNHFWGHVWDHIESLTE